MYVFTETTFSLYITHFLAGVYGLWLLGIAVAGLKMGSAHDLEDREVLVQIFPIFLANITYEFAILVILMLDRPTHRLVICIIHATS